MEEWLGEIITEDEGNGEGDLAQPSLRPHLQGQAAVEAQVLWHLQLQPFMLALSPSITKMPTATTSV